jgi:hypothetical protein
MRRFGMSEESKLKQMNTEYVKAFMRADVGWYAKNLADEFVCIDSDASLLDKAAFLASAAHGPRVKEYNLIEVRVRFVGELSDVALVQARGAFTRKDGTIGTSRYVDVYERRDGRWLAISAQTTQGP